jgi:tetratricopeptide (TPR) repeat protein
VIVEGLPGGGYSGRAFLRPDGSFDLPAISAGIYQVSLVAGRGDVLWRDVVTIGPDGRLVIQLTDGAPKQTRAETVSISRLAHKYPASALRELHLADQASKQKRPADANSHLLRALEIAPDMQDARNNLGANFLQTGNFEAARRELEAAVALDSENPTPQVNLALTLLALGRAPEAQQHARLALRRDPLSPKANFAMGAALARQGEPKQALRYLECADEAVPQSLLIEARILLATPDVNAAIAKLRGYLSRPNITQRAEVQRWLDALIGQAASPERQL